MIRRLLIVDTETDGLAAESRVLEIGAILYSIESQTPLVKFSALVPADANAAAHVNRIPIAALAEMREVAVIDALTIVNALFSVCDVVCAHNASFDRKFFPAWQSKPWICTREDFSWPNGKLGDSLVNLALAHGIAVVSAHRALTDCDLISELFSRVHDLSDRLEHAMRPKSLFRALVSYDDKQLAKDAGFSWIHDRKSWERRMPAEDAALLPFKTVEVSAR